MVVAGDVLEHYVRFSVYDKNIVMKNHLIGTQEIPLKLFLDKWLQEGQQSKIYFAPENSSRALSETNKT